jgi:hypothetical protein
VRKRKIVNYSDCVQRATKKQKDMSGQDSSGNCPRGAEIPRSPAVRAPPAGLPDENDAVLVDDSASDCSTPTVKETGTNNTVTLDSLGSMMATVVAQNETLVQKFTTMEHRLDYHTGELRRLDGKIDGVESRLSRQVHSQIDEKLSHFESKLKDLGNPPRALPSTSKESREEQAYWTARRSLRFSPVLGPDLKHGTIKFVESCLEADSAIVAALQPSAFRQAPTSRKATIKNEVVVVFESVQDRDYFKSLSYRLSGKKDHSVRLELPSHLLGQHRVLGSAGQELRSGRSGTRTNIKFDDSNLRLVLDYRVPNGEWMRLCPDQAAEAISQPEGGSIKETTATAFKQLLRPATGANATGLGE